MKVSVVFHWKDIDNFFKPSTNYWLFFFRSTHLLHHLTQNMTSRFSDILTSMCKLMTISHGVPSHVIFINNQRVDLTVTTVHIYFFISFMFEIYESIYLGESAKSISKKLDEKR